MKTRLLSFASLLLVVTATTFADTFGTGGNQFTIDFVTIGNPGNPVDALCDPYCPNPMGAGSVDYVFDIGKYEISRAMVEKANAEGNLRITLEDRLIVTGGIRPTMPATGVSWNEAARFVNFLNTSQGYPAAYKFGKQPGDAGYKSNDLISQWEPPDPGYDASNLFRNSRAHYFLPSMDEWYKAAFYDPNANGGAGGYWNYPTGSDFLPAPVASGTDPGTAVRNNSIDQGPADITQAGGLSPYGTMAQGGNVWEWEESDGDLVNDDRSSDRGVRGGDWTFIYASNSLSVMGRLNVSPSFEWGALGFRVASIPEPSTACLGASGAVWLLVRRRSQHGVMLKRWHRP